ncbi:MAG: hypothetical protein JNJ73_10390 [Hyphomonadaceae bacterium]|nr:hypothetical protein [Hyphomonadaceae bacterium]
MTTSNDNLTKLTIDEQIRLVLPDATQDEYTRTLTRADVLMLARQTALTPTNSMKSWCVLTSVSLFNVRTERLLKREHGVSAGFWIITASGRYAETSQAIIPEPVITFAIEEFDVAEVRQAAAGLDQAPPNTPAPPVRPAPAPSAIALADRIVSAPDYTQAQLEAGAAESLASYQAIQRQDFQRAFNIDANRARDLLNNFGAWGANLPQDLQRQPSLTPR